eukprot:5439560-Amphidinium_carterae.1
MAANGSSLAAGTYGIAAWCEAATTSSNKASKRMSMRQDTLRGTRPSQDLDLATRTRFTWVLSLLTVLNEVASRVQCASLVEESAPRRPGTRTVASNSPTS